MVCVWFVCGLGEDVCGMCVCVCVSASIHTQNRTEQSRAEQSSHRITNYFEELHMIYDTVGKHYSLPPYYLPHVLLRCDACLPHTGRNDPLSADVRPLCVQGSCIDDHHGVQLENALSARELGWGSKMRGG